MSEDDSEDSDDAAAGDDPDGSGGNNGTKVTGVPLAVAQADAAEAAKSAATRAHKFMPPIEVELQMQQLWKHEADTLDLIFASGKQQHHRPRQSGAGSAAEGGDALSLAVSNGGGGATSGGIYDGYRVFFVRALAVPPPRFRPPMHMGDMVAEHPQNVYLIKVSGVC